MLLSERLEGVHPDRILGILEAELAGGHENRVRQALPRLLELHFSIRPELEALRERLGDEPAAAAETVVEGDATAFACGACGGALAAQAPDTVLVVCAYCGTENDASTRATGYRWDAVLDPESPFHVGSFFERDGARWQVIGMQHYRGRIREWDAEDSDWETNPAEYTVWWMLDERRRIAYLGDDGDKRYWSEAQVPDDPSVPPSDSRHHEHGEWELVDVVGELSYRPRPGERLLTAERMSGARGTSVERRLDERGEPVEIGFYRETRMDDDEVLAGLGDAGVLAAVRSWRRSSLWFVAAAAALALGFGALKLAFDDAPVFDATVPGAVTATTGNPDGLALGAFETVGPFPPHRLRVAAQTPLARNSAVSVEIRLVSNEAGVDANVAFELWHETGRDSDGAWTDTRYSVDRTLDLPRPARFEVYAAAVEGERTAVPSLHVTVAPNAFPGLPVLVGLLLAGLGFLVCRLRAGALRDGAVSLAHVPRARGRDHRRHVDRDAGTFVDVEPGGDVDRDAADGRVVGRHAR